MNQFALTCILVAINLQVPVEAADQSCDRWNCDFFLTNQEVVRKQFAQIDHSKIWLVYLNLTEQPKGSSDARKQTLILTWTQSSSTPFLTFDSNFEVYSFSMLTEAVAQINMRATSEGADPSRDCLVHLPLNCRNRTIAKEILSKVTDMKGAVCFGDRGKSPSRRCCEQSEGNKTDIKCGIEPQSGWRWLDISYLSALFGIAGYFSFAILLCLLPSLPDSQNGIEVTALLDPSPLSLFNIFVKCFNHKPAHCFRDVFATFCCRIIVYFGIIPSVLYLNTIAFRAFSKKVYFVYESDAEENFRYIIFGCYVIFATYAVSVSIVAFLEYFLQPIGRESLRLGGFIFDLSVWLFRFSPAVLAKSSLNRMTAFCHLLYWYLIPFCCQDRRKISKPCNLPLGFFIVLSPCFFVFLFFCALAAIFAFPFIYCVLLTTMCGKCFDCLLFSGKRISAGESFYIFLSPFVFVAQVLTIIYNYTTLASFTTYTIIGFVLSYKVNLPLLSAAVLAITYVYQFYRSTNESYDKLRRITFEVCTEMQTEMNNDNKNQQLTSSSLHLQEQGENGERQPLLSNQTRQLIYVDENGCQLIPKKLFENICWEIKPISFSFFVLTTKVFGILIFVTTLVGVVLTLTPRSEFGTLTQVAITIFVGGLPKILAVFSKNSEMEKLQTTEMKSKIRKCVKNYLEIGELSEEQLLELEWERAFKMVDL